MNPRDLSRLIVAIRQDLAQRAERVAGLGRVRMPLLLWPLPKVAKSGTIPVLAIIESPPKFFGRDVFKLHFFYVA